MKELTEEQVQNMLIKPPGRTSRARSIITNMKPGQIILLEPSDWNQKQAPGQLLSRIKKRTGMHFQYSIPLKEPGWIIKRVK